MEKLNPTLDHALPNMAIDAGLREFMLAASVGRDASEDLTQEAFLRVVASQTPLGRRDTPKSSCLRWPTISSGTSIAIETHSF